MQRDLSPVIVETITLYIPAGKIPTACEFFTTLFGWHQKHEDQAQYILKRAMLWTESNKQLNIELLTLHQNLEAEHCHHQITLALHQPDNAIQVIQRWSEKRSMRCSAQQLDNGSWSVKISQLFLFTLILKEAQYDTVS